MPAFRVEVEVVDEYGVEDCSAGYAVLAPDEAVAELMRVKWPELVVEVGLGVRGYL